MRVAIIDLGTNSVRFDVHQFGPGRRSRLLHREKLMVRLGQGAFVHGRLDRAAITRTLHAFERFAAVSQQLKAAKVIAFGTSALREVSDRDRFIDLIRARTGIEVRVISGSEEAKLIAHGVLGHERIGGNGRVALVDIGGGSTEISICRGATLARSTSFPLGTARLQQLFLKKSPPDPRSIEEVRKFIRNTILQESLAAKWPKVDRVIGSSGTIKAIARILRKGRDSNLIERSILEKLNERMSLMTTTELLGIDGMESRRVDMVLAGSILLEEAMSVLGAKKALSTEFSLRDGILDEELQLYQEGASSHLSLHLPDLLDKARVFGGDPKHLARVAALAGNLFDRLASVHRLAPRWKVYLQAATLLRDTGEAVSLSGHEEHSAYIVRNADLPPMDEWEIELIACLCLFHEGSAKTDLKKLPIGKHKARREAFARLLALLRVVDSLDTGPATEVRIQRCRVLRGKVELAITGRRLTGLESLNAELKSAYFEKVFGRALGVVSR